MYPLSLGGISLNYLYILWIPFSRKVKFYRYRPFAFTFALCALISYGIGLFSLIGYADSFELIRQFLSFGAFLSAILLLFVKLPFSYKDLTHAIVVAAAIYSIYSLTVFFLLDSVSFQDPLYAKSYLRNYIPGWPQRYISIVLFANIVSLSLLRKNTLWFFAFVVTFLCVVISFLRASYIALTCGYLAFIFMNLQIRNIAYHTREILFFIISSALVVVLFRYLFTQVYHSAIHSINIMFGKVSGLLKYAKSGNITFSGSVSERLTLYKEQLNILSTRPIFGTGFAGIYIFQESAGSSHSDILDVALSMGLTGLIFYLYLYLRVFCRFSYKNVGISTGILTLFVFGLFHEITALSFGSFILFGYGSLSYKKG